MTERIHPDSREITSSVPRRTGRSRLPVRLVIAFALVVGLVTWVVVREVGGGSKPAARAPALAVTAAGLQTLATALPVPVDWIGPEKGYTYEFTKTSGNQIYIRYLPTGVAAGSSGQYLTVGTYPVANAFAVTRDAAAASGTVKVAIGHGGIAFYSSSAPEHVYFAYPGTSYQVEVFDPSPGHAAQLVSSGQVKPVVERVGAVPARAVTQASLESLSAALAHPLYWAGPAAAGTRYELTVTSAGNIFVRYLPKGVPVGSSKAYEMVATYPVASAFTVTKTLAAKPGAVRVAVEGGAVAFYSSSRPTNVYLADPGSNYQVEVYDPSAARAHRLVASHAIVPVP